MTREPFLRTRAGRVSLLAMPVVDVLVLAVARAIPLPRALTGHPGESRA